MRGDRGFFRVIIVEKSTKTRKKERKQRGEIFQNKSGKKIQYISRYNI